MAKIKDLTGKKFNRLTALVHAGKSENGKRYYWLCQCDCGNIKRIEQYKLVSHSTKSCGCLKREGNNSSHGHTINRRNSPTYRSWNAMRSRCLNEKNDNYKHYGGRGIKVCDRWMKFENFLADMGERPEGKTIDRIDNNGNYEISNCRWKSMDFQRKHKRNILNIDERKQVLHLLSIGKKGKDIASLFNVANSTISNIKRGKYVQKLLL